MKKVSLNQLKLIAGGQSDENDQPSARDKARDVLNDGLESIGDNLEKLLDKIHDTTKQHNN